jgi:hypothetical protein
MATFNWDNNDYQDERPNYDPVPAGIYRLKALEAEEKTTSTGGEMISVKYQICEGEYKGRFIWNNFNVVNKSAQAERIGRSQVAAWARACGKPNASSTDQLLDAPFSARVKIEEQAGYKPRNQIDGFVSDAPANRAAEPSKPSAPKATAAKPAAPAPKPPMGNQKNPWEND